MLEDFFFTYANLDLLNDANSIVALADEVEPHISHHKSDRERFRFQLEFIGELAQIDDPEKALSRSEEIGKYLGQRGPIWVSTDIFCAWTVVYCYAASEVIGTKVQCPDRCNHYYWTSLSETMKRYSEKGIRLKCHECFQLNFRDMLVDISKQGLGTVIADPIRHGLSTYLKTALDSIEITMGFEENHISEQGRIKTGFYHTRGRFLNESFEKYIVSLLGYSLVQYLIKNGDQHIKLCPYCNRFFHARNKKRSYCYGAECKRIFEREKKRSQRDKDPVKYV